MTAVSSEMEDETTTGGRLHRGEPTAEHDAAAGARTDCLDSPTRDSSTLHRRYLVNDPRNFGNDLIEGYVASWPRFLRRTPEGLVVRRRRKRRGQVGLVIGNGVGHEPAMMGLVGHGLFDVNVPGDLFAAPPAGAIVRGIRAADRGAGVLVCVSNHSGDVLTAEMALEMIEGNGPACEMVVLGEDISSDDTDGSGRRGGPGLFFVWKCVGAAAEGGEDLESCARIASLACEQTRSLSATIRGTVNPATGQETVAVPEGSILVGTGVHGDGTGSLVEWCTARDLATLMVERLAPALGLDPGESCLTMINDAGALSVAEAALIHAGVLDELEKRGVRVVGSWIGRYATTLATAGLAVGLCKVNDELLRLWRAPCHAPALSSWGGGPVG